MVDSGPSTMPIVLRSRSTVYCLLSTVYCLLSTVFGPLSSAAPVFTSSASGRFVVIGSDTAHNAGVIRWAEETAEQWESLLGRPFPASRAKPMEIMLVESHRAGSPAVTIDAPAGDESAPRRLTFSRKAPVDIDQRREGLIRLALKRMVASGRFEAGLPAVEPQLPLWLVVGLAGNLDKTMTVRNHALWTGTAMEEEGDVAVGEVLSWTRLPEGWYGRRAACGLVLTWLLSCPGTLDRILDRLITQEPLSVEWLAEKGVETRTVARLESRWRAWNERQDRAIREFGGLSPALISQLREVAQPVEPSGETRARESLAQKKIQDIRALTLGKAPELVEVGEQYCRYYEGVVRGAWAMTQRRRLARAVTALERLETLTRAREAWVDEVEGKQGSGFRVQGSGGGLQGSGGGTGLDKSRMEAYVDEVERGNCQVKGEE